MVEKAHACKYHNHTVLIGGLDDMVVAYAPARLRNVLYAAFAGALNVVSEGKERV